MAWRSGSLSRSLLNAARTPAVRTTTTTTTAIRRPSSPLLPNPLRQSRRLNFSNPRTIGALGIAQSMMPLHSVVASTRLTSHIVVEARACCELSQGT